MKNKPILWSGLVVLFFLGACSNLSQEQKEMEQRILADSLFVRMKDSIDIELDSLCQAYQKQHWDQTVDSILQNRQEQVQEQLEKNKRRRRSKTE